MFADREREIERICQAALDRPRTERDELLARECGEDADLRRDVERLLAHESAASEFLRAPALAVAAQGLGGSVLTNGQQVGAYTILSPLGSGGMGEVYRARDATLGREVAIKVLPEIFTSDAERLARFEREARVLAALNHPNIATIHGVERVGDTYALVLEVVEGETLAEMIAGRPLAVEQALAIARQITDALEAAHDKGIVHRDLKPANIKIRPDGVVKVLDFGLAKVSEACRLNGAGTSLFRSPTITVAGAHESVLLGTAAYMSPEQARGEAATDHRTDIWAFGCVLYEMLTGRMAFGASTVTETLAKVLEGHADLNALPAQTPAAIRRLVRRCLERSLRDRVQHIGDARADIVDAIKPGARATEPDVPAVGGTRFTGMIAGSIAGIAIGAAVTTLMVPLLTTGRDSPSRDVSRVLLGIGPAEQLRVATDTQAELGQLSTNAIALAPDGRTLVFSAVRGDRQQLYARALDQLDAIPIPGTDGAANPFLSPDGEWIGFWAGGALKKVPLSGGVPTTLCETTAVFGASWGSNDIILFAHDTGGLWQVPAVGGTPTAVTAVDEQTGEVSHRLPQVLPGSQAVIFTVTRTLLPTWDDTLIVAQSLTTGARKLLIEGGADGRYVPTGHLVYVHRSTLMAVPFSARDLTVSGDPVALSTEVMQAANMPNSQRDSGAGQFSIAASGSLAYVPGGIFSLQDRSLAWVNQSGRVETLPMPPRAYTYPRLSPDEKRVLVSTQGDRNVWIYELGRGTPTMLREEGRSQAAIWTPDGTRVTFGSSTTGNENLFLVPADGTAIPQRLTKSPLLHRASAWSPDGQVLAFVAAQINPNHYDVMTLSGEGQEPVPLLSSRFNESHPEFSPDGRWLAYASDESGRSEIYVRHYPGPGTTTVISIDGGTAPVWARNGKQLFYLAPALPAGKAPLRMMAVSVTLGTGIATARPRVLFETNLSPGASIRNYDVARDGRFLIVQNHERPPIRPTQIVLVQNWLEELKRRVPRDTSAE